MIREGTNTDHPRVCGEQMVGSLMQPRSCGSSPRVRGTESTRRLPGLLTRIIPACAGNRKHPSPAWSPHADHPRVCGEQNFVGSAIHPSPGSSPRVRGTGPRRRRNGQPERIIPACAGNRRAAGTTRHRSADHPRVCGEQSTIAGTNGCTTGSSPRVRGTVPVVVLDHVQARIIPACAGNSFVCCCGHWYLPDHPRVCGEQAAASGGRTVQAGSSPRVRGTAGLARSALRVIRIIPACAGNSKILPNGITIKSDHPRVCGEQVKSRVYHRHFAGSSPRVRGTEAEQRAEERADRIIPACAGNRFRCEFRCDPSTDHPRVCGEQCSGHGTHQPDGGSSPRVRGTGYSLK